MDNLNLYCKGCKEMHEDCICGEDHSIPPVIEEVLIDEDFK